MCQFEESPRETVAACEMITIILLLAEDGVIVALRPESVKEVEMIEVRVFVVP